MNQPEQPSYTSTPRNLFCCHTYSFSSCSLNIRLQLQRLHHTVDVSFRASQVTQVANMRGSRDKLSSKLFIKKPEKKNLGKTQPVAYRNYEYDSLLIARLLQMTIGLADPGAQFQH